MANEIVLAKNIGEAKELLYRAMDEFATRLPARLGMTPDQFAATAITCFARNPALLHCSRTSVFEALYSAARLGLMPGVLNSAHLVPFRMKTGEMRCTLIPGYGGLRDLAIRSGAVLAAYAYPLYALEEFAAQLGDSPKIHHIPAPFAFRGEFVAAYAVAVLRECVKQVDVMWKEEIDAIRARSRAGNSGPWVTDYTEMAKKTVLRRLLKQVPQTPDLSAGLQLDADAERPDDSSPVRQRTQADLLADAVAAKPEREDDPDYPDAGVSKPEEPKEDDDAP